MVGDPDMLEHTDRSDFVITAFERRIVAQLQRHAILQAEARDFFRGILELLLRQRHAMRRHTVVLRRMTYQRTPAAADVKQRVAGLQAQFAAGHVELVALRGCNIVAPVDKITAGIDHLGIEEERVERIGEVVVELDVLLVLALAAAAWRRAAVQRIA